MLTSVDMIVCLNLDIITAQGFLDLRVAVIEIKDHQVEAGLLVDVMDRITLKRIVVIIVGFVRRDTLTCH